MKQLRVENMHFKINWIKSKVNMNSPKMQQFNYAEKLIIWRSSSRGTVRSWIISDNNLNSLSKHKILFLKYFMNAFLILKIFYVIKQTGLGKRIKLKEQVEMEVSQINWN